MGCLILTQILAVLEIDVRAFIMLVSLNTALSFGASLQPRRMSDTWETGKVHEVGKLRRPETSDGIVE